MLISPYRFHIVHNNIRPVRLLMDDEKEQIIEQFKSTNSSMHTMHVNSLIAIELDAKVDDIICINNNSNYLYRRVTN